MVELITFLTLILLGLIFGQLNERRHFARLARDEEAYSHIVTVNLKDMPDRFSTDGEMVSGNVVIALDYLKKFIAGILMIFGLSLIHI